MLAKEGWERVLSNSSVGHMRMEMTVVANYLSGFMGICSFNPNNKGTDYIVKEEIETARGEATSPRAAQ